MLRWVDGYEQYGATARMLEGVGGAAAWSEMNEFNLSTANPATGTYHMRASASDNFSQRMRRALGQSKQVSALGYRFALTSLPDTEGVAYLALVKFRDVANTEQCRINLGTEGSVHAVGAGLDHRSDPCIAAGGYHHIETKTKIHNSTGYIEVRVNEVTVLNVTGVDTQTSANAESSQFEFGMYPVVTNTVGSTIDIDDVFAWDDDASDPENTVVDFVGDKGCYFLKPNGDTATSTWTRSTGPTDYTLLDEVPPDGVDYLSDTTGAARTIVQVEALPANVAEVIAMMPVIYARKEESGTVNLRGGVVVGADESYTASDSPSTQYAYMTPTPKTIDPDTGVAWASNANPDLLIERTA
jgi:hypothetical protein